METRDKVYDTLEPFIKGQKIEANKLVILRLINTHFNNEILPIKVDIHNPTHTPINELFQVGLEIPFTTEIKLKTDYIKMPTGAKMKIVDIGGIFPSGWVQAEFDFKVKREEMQEKKDFDATLWIFAPKRKSIDIRFRLVLEPGYEE